MNYTLSEVTEFVAHWEAKPESEQRTVCLKYWVNRLQAFTAYSRKGVASDGEPVLLPNTYADSMDASRTVAKFFGVPAKKKNEDRHASMMRLKYLTLPEWEGVDCVDY